MPPWLVEVMLHPGEGVGGERACLLALRLTQGPGVDFKLLKAAS